MLNKRECRKFADPDLRMNVGQGILYASQIGYIVRTAVKIIDHHRTLVLYIYSREKAAGGDFTPLWTMFHISDDYITLARRDDGSTYWRTAVFDQLGEDYCFVAQCAFYTPHDEQRLHNFFHEEKISGFSPLIAAQRRIQERRRKASEDKRDRRIIQRMSCVPVLPRGLTRWTRSVMPAYFFYDRKKKRRSSTIGLCTSCGHEVEIDNVRHNAKATCPHCGREVTMKSRGKRGSIYDRDTAQVVQRVGSDEVVVRVIKIHYSYDKNQDMPTVTLVENARQFIRRDTDGTAHIEHYYNSYSIDGLTPWKQGSRPVLYYSYSYEADICGYIYCGNLPGAIRDTPFQYCPIVSSCSHFAGERMELFPVLQAHLEHPRFEHLIKAGFFMLAASLAYPGDYDHTLDETQNRTHRILQVAAEDVPFLRELGVDIETLKTFQSYAGLRDRQKLLKWQMENKVERDIMPILTHMTAHKLMRYVDEQYANQGGNDRFSSLQRVVSEYRDYLDMCGKLGCDMGNNFVLYPKDLCTAHDKAAHRLKIKADAQLRRDFKAAYQSISQHLDFEAKGMKVLLPTTPEDLAAEGNALHHCVGSYADRVARKECIILFLRQCSDLTKPFFTIEVQGRKVTQVRGMKNCPATPDVDAFVTQWEQQVLQVSAA